MPPAPASAAAVPRTSPEPALSRVLLHSRKSGRARTRRGCPRRHRAIAPHDRNMRLGSSARAAASCANATTRPCSGRATWRPSSPHDNPVHQGVLRSPPDAGRSRNVDLVTACGNCSRPDHLLRAREPWQAPHAVHRPGLLSTVALPISSRGGSSRTTHASHCSLTPQYCPAVSDDTRLQRASGHAALRDPVRTIGSPIGIASRLRASTRTLTIAVRPRLQFADRRGVAGRRASVNIEVTRVSKSLVERGIRATPSHSFRYCAGDARTALRPNRKHSARRTSGRSATSIRSTSPPGCATIRPRSCGRWRPTPC